MKKIHIIILVCICLILTGCGKKVIKEVNTQNRFQKEKLEAIREKLKKAPSKEEDNLSEKTLEVEEVFNYDSPIDKNASLIDFAYEGKNIIFSPLSLDMALAMASEGAREETLKELTNFLGRDDYKNFARRYIENSNFSIANSFWGNMEVVLKESYLNTLIENYEADVDYLDFSNPNSASVVNGWIEDKTSGMIKEALSPTDINDDLVNILVNTVYFEKGWLKKWDIIDGIFKNLDGSTYNGEMLSSSTNVYYENNKATAFGKEYEDGLYFIGILPNDEGEFNMKDLDIQSLLSTETREYDVSIEMPRFNIETSLDLKEILTKMGIRNVFSKSADFSGISDNAGEISKIFQDCKIELDEEGTRAAAATIIMVGKNAIFREKEKKYVYLDRPFAFLIYDKNEEQILFMGKVVHIK